ncbi:MAG TPA: methyltransferase domain-containing protein [Acidimicrobiales bacterium]|nr:methyltransferase domain-containing protein [Acidimicrobiales bacterium]
MDRATVAIYQRSAAEYAARRRAQHPERAAEFTARVPAGGVRVDLGCGPGLYLPYLGTPVVATDAAPAMLAEARRRHPGTPAVACDLGALPLRGGSVDGVWASKCLQHVDRGRLPGVLGGLHRTLAVGGVLDLTVFRGEGADSSGPDDDFPGRRFTWWEPGPLTDVLVGAGFTVEDVTAGDGDHARLTVRAVRARTLADTVAPGMRLLMCGLNPSLYAADAGIGFARPGNRYWPAMLAAGLVTVDRSPERALADHGVGMTDIVKRATVAAAELTRDEYVAGLGRVERLVGWLRPRAVCFVGLAGWRAAVDRRAVGGVQPAGLGGTPVYVMPSTSGLNAATGLAVLTDHLRAAATLAG